MKLVKVSDRVFVGPTSNMPGASNAGIVVLENYVVVVDSYRNPRLAYEFRKAVDEEAPKRVKKLVLTHDHGDHVFGCQAFSDCEIISQESTGNTIMKNLESIWSPKGLEALMERFKSTQPERAEAMKGLTIITPTITFDKRLTIWDGSLKVDVEHVGGHTPGGSIVYFSEEQILFSGDMIFAKMFPFGADPRVNPDQWIEGLERVLDLKPKKIVPGHGVICDIDEAKEYLRFLENVRKQMKEMIIHDQPEDQVINSEYPKFYEAWSPDMRRSSLAQWYKIWKQQM